MPDSDTAQRAAPAKKAVSSETAFVLEADDARFLAEIGMLAAGRGDLKHAGAIFGALCLLRPDRAYPLVGLAVAHLNAGRAADAVRLLEAAMLQNPEERGVLLAWHGLALQFAGRSAESRRLLAEAAALPGEGARLARQMLGLPEENLPAEAP